MNSAIAQTSFTPASRGLIAPRWHAVLLPIFLMIPLGSGLVVQSRKNPGSQILTNHSAARGRAMRDIGESLR